MRFRTRAFLLCFVPFALLLAVSFWVIQGFVQSTVRDGLRRSLGENQAAIARLHSKSDLQNSRFLKVAGENASLKAGIELLLSESGSNAARRTVEDQLREMGEHMGFDFLLVSSPNGAPLAGVVRRNGQLVPVDTALPAPGDGLIAIDGRIFQAASVPVDRDDGNIGSLAVGEYFDFSEFTTPAVLIHYGKVIQSSIPDVSRGEIEAALSACKGPPECDVRLRGIDWLSLPMRNIPFGDGFLLRSMENVDAATGPVQSILRNVFLIVAAGSVLIALLCSVATSRSIVRPIAAVVFHLRNTERTGVLPEFENDLSPIREIQELAESYNRAARSVRDARENLQGAYVEFIGSLANALDARDRSTAGHSRRVSRYACATAAAMGLEREDIERIRMGALLHDIGKIGIADTVLQKVGRLTHEEYALIQEHPSIGRRILEGVQGFAPFLAAVELHHENWDGTGYPKSQAGEETPVDARIIHVADAYDAMTTDRPYRRGMTHEQAIHILRANSGTQFDPRIVDLFTKLPRAIGEAADPAGARVLDAVEAA
jgi:HD-GYP domain-containing protein (c-di-GMP phosphodiesterase class II)